MTLGVFALVSLACYRLTRLATTDEISRPLRDALARRYPPRTEPLRDAAGKALAGSATLVPRPPVVLANCAWCVSVWIVLAVLLALHFLTSYVDPWSVLVLSWLAISTVVGFLSRLEA